MKEKILIIDDEPKIRKILKLVLEREGFEVAEAASGEEAIETAQTFTPEIIVMDLNLPDLSGIQAMEKIRTFHPEVITLILTAYGTISSAVEAIKKGAYDYLTKPIDNEELLMSISRALHHRRLAAEVETLREQLRERYRFENIIGVSAKMQEVFERMDRVCRTDATVLIQGESGTGKELIVRAMHYNSPRKDQPLVAINCGAVPVNLLESEFFGHEKGAFTDARERKIGKFEQAHGGTLFLDEIGELPLDAQVKLLRFLDERKITRIGGSQAIPVDARLIAATNKNLEEEVAKGAFRLDLLYRLNVFTITLPPLRERTEDIPLLVEHFIQKYNNRLGCNIESVSKSAMLALQAYHWPGNVRDLENAVESAMILASNEVIQLQHLPLRVRGYPEIEATEDLADLGLEEHTKRMTEIIEKELILKALEKWGHNRTLTAEHLKISRKTLFNKMKQYELL